MERTRAILVAVSLAGAFLCSSCGSPGPPLPPSLELARPVRDLRASRKGNQVTLTWTVPTQTTDQQNIRHSGVTQICRSLGRLTQCGTPVGTVNHAKERQPAQSKIGTYVDSLPTTANSPTDHFTYAVNVLNPYGKSAGLSNLVAIPGVQTLAPPNGLEAQVTADGIRLNWSRTDVLPQVDGAQFLFRVYRRSGAGGPEIVVGEVPAVEGANTFLDKNFEWEKVYDYRVTPVGLVRSVNGIEQVEGDDATLSKVAAHDVFPPATPEGLQAAYTASANPPYIDLVWAPDVDADLAGYNLYRREQNGTAVKINSELIKSSSYKDTTITRGSQYSYSVSAVDVRGNESARSEEAAEAVPNE